MEATPSTPLQAARRTVGWKQSRALSELTAQARVAGIAIASAGSLKTMLSRWENGNGRPDLTYQRLLCAIYEREPEELGFTVTLDRPSSPRSPQVVDAGTVDYFATIFEQHLRADQLMGPQLLLDVVRAQAELLDRVLPDVTSGKVREQLLRLACQYNEFAGWLYQDAGDPDTAMVLSDRAMDKALAIDDPTHTVYLLMRKSNIASDQGKPDRAVVLAEAATRLLPKVAPNVRALVLSQGARAHALRGAADASARSLDIAMREASRPESEPDPIASYCSPEYVAMESAACWTSLARPTKAIPIFERALASWPVTQRRDLGLCQARLATAYADMGDAERAAETGHEAVLTVQHAASARSLQELSRVRDKLVPWRRESRVSELSTLIRGLTRAA